MASRRFSQAISEGDGISVIVAVQDAAGARDAEAQGAEAIVVRDAFDGLREATELPILWLDLVIQVGNEEELEEVLDGPDPEIFLLAPEAENDDWDSTFDLLASIPAGKLAIAAFPAPSREQVIELERAGVDAVIVGARNVAELVGDAPPQV